MVETREACHCKLGRVTAEYELSSVDSWLVEEWQSGTSVRQLTEELNKDIVASELNTTNIGHVEWSRTPVYEALHTDKLSEAEEVEIQRELDRAGADVEQLASDLVSHQTVYRHLTQCLEASKDDDQTPAERREKAKDTVYAMQHRTEVVTESTLDTLEAAGVTDLGEVEVLVDLQVVCSDCGRSMDFESAIRKGCDCTTT